MKLDHAAAYCVSAVTLVAMAIPMSVAWGQRLHVEGLRTEYSTNPVGTDARVPRLSWKLHAARRGTTQSAYQIRVGAGPSDISRSLIWDSGRVSSTASIFRAYGGPALESAKRYYWQVRVWDDAGTSSEWSAPAYWETGLLRSADWRASWITPDLPEDTTASNASPMLRDTFVVRGRVASARAYVSSLGLYELELNGQRVGDQLFTPGWTSYDTRVQYQAYDVTSLLRPGANAIGAMLGDGWYRGRLMGGPRRRNVYGRELALIAQILIRYTDGREEVIGTGGDWRSSTGPILMADIYDGETYDARLEKSGWSTATYDDGDWRGVRTLDRSKETLIAPQGPAVRRVQELKPAKVFVTPAGQTVADMGQNMVGWMRIRLRGPAGTVVRLHHAEVLDKAGNVYTANLRGAKQRVQYTLRGRGEETYEPHFTFQGFRYVVIEGWPGTPSPDALTGMVIHSDMPRSGTFETSDSLLNRLHHNIVWGQKGNFLDVPTDCPQRDERLGWTGDAQVFAPTAAFNMDVSGFFAKWLGDLAADQKPNGVVPDVIPDVLTRGRPAGNGATGWADAAVIVPWTMYVTYGDSALLARQYPSMQRWVEYMRREVSRWRGGWHYGDWLAFATTRADYPGATTDKDLLAIAFFAHGADLLARSASVLGKTSDVDQYRALFDSVRTGFQREFVTATGRLSSNTQTAYSLALAFDLLSDGARTAAAQRLADDVRRFGHLTTGFLGTPHLMYALSDNGRLDLAYMLLQRKQFPSWLYPITQGATTIWERWDGQRPDGSFQDEGMNSFNHYAYGAVGGWMYSTIAGLDLDPREPAYKHSFIRPQPGGGLTRASASLETSYGQLASSWTRDSTTFTLDALVPANTRSTITLSDVRLGDLTESGQPVREGNGIRSVRQQGSAVIVEVGSGRYRFVKRGARARG